MLSRVAESLYWMSRYLERAEHTARLIDVHYNLILDIGAESADQGWRRVLACLGSPPPDEPGEAQQMVQSLTFDLSNSSSIVGLISAARENARQVREQISSEMWTQLNQLFHSVRRGGSFEMPDVQPLDFLEAVKDGAHLFQGITDSTMSHGEGWQFIQLGRAIERAAATATLIDVYFKEMLEPHEVSEETDPLELAGLLKCCTAFEAYCKVYTADVRVDRIAEFLLLNAEFPHSVRFCSDRLYYAHKAIEDATSARKVDRVERLAGRMRANLGFAQIDEIMSGGIHNYLESIKRQCAQIHSAVNEVYITYPIDMALEA